MNEMTIFAWVVNLNSKCTSIENKRIKWRIEDLIPKTRLHCKSSSKGNFCCFQCANILKDFCIAKESLGLQAQVLKDIDRIEKGLIRNKSDITKIKSDITEIKSNIGQLREETGIIMNSISQLIGLMEDIRGIGALSERFSDIVQTNKDN